jgi:hypothetical protein
MPEMPFEPGKSGNPAGKLKGTRNKTTLAVEALLDGEAETITRKAIELAKEGNLTALRLCLDRIAPWPLAARAQQGERTRRVGVLMNLAADDPEGQTPGVGARPRRRGDRMTRRAREPSYLACHRKSGLICPACGA